MAKGPLTLNLSTETDASDKDFTEKGVTFRAKVMELKTVTTVKAYTQDKKENHVRLQYTPAIQSHQGLSSVGRSHSRPFPLKEKPATEELFIYSTASDPTQKRAGSFPPQYFRKDWRKIYPRHPQFHWQWQIQQVIGY